MLSPDNCRNFGTTGKQVSLCRKCEPKRSMKYATRAALRRGGTIKQLNKRRAVQYKGGKCHRCGLETEYDAVYDFHHLDTSSKAKTLSGNVVGS